MNRKLIRTTLAEVKGRGEGGHHRERGESQARSGGGGSQHRGGSSSSGGGGGGGGDRGSSQQSKSGAEAAAAQSRKKVPPTETNAEIFYYKKQMDAHTPMVIMLQDGEEIEGTIEWYDRDALKVNRKTAPNILLLKHNIKYMYKAEDRKQNNDGEGAVE